jgi:hypothetical protein
VSWQGLPDFQRPIRAEGCEILYPYEGMGAHTLLPDRLEVAERGDGRPDFSLELVRGENPLLPPAPYGVLDLRLRPRYRIDEALRALRDRHPSRMISRASFSAGFLRLRPLGDATDVPADLLEPVPLSWNGLGVARWILRLSPDGITLLTRSLQSELLALAAAAEVELFGVSPRLPLQVHFDPRSLLEMMLARADAQRRIAWADLVALFRRDPASLSIGLVGAADGVDRDELAGALADRVRLRFGAFIPSPREDAGPYVRLASADEIGRGRVEWDLAQPVAVPRVLMLALDPLESARELVARAGLDAVMRETVVPPIPTGVLPVLISANLPDRRVGLLAVGVEIRAPARPPHRVQAVVESAELTPPEDAATVRLRLSPAEPPEYTFSTFVVVRDGSGIERLDGEPRPHRGPRLDLSPDMFSVEFVLVEAGRPLLEQASVQGICRRSDRGTAVSQPFELTLARPAIALALPRGTTGATLEVEARLSDGSRSLELGPLPAQNLQLDLHSFPEYGPHRIEIVCVFDDDRPLVAIDLLPEGRPEAPEEITALHFTPAQPRREWNWLAPSPFRAGYRYRPHLGPEEPPASWSAVRSPFEDLEISARATGGGGT